MTNFFNSVTTMFLARTSEEDILAGYVVGLLFGISIVLIINALIAKKFEQIAFGKGYDTEIHAFAMCFFLGIIGYIYVLALPNLHAAERETEILKTLKKIEASTTNGNNNAH